MSSQKWLIRIVLGIMGAGMVLAIGAALTSSDDDFLVAAIVTAICAACGGAVIVMTAHWLAPRTRPVVVYCLWATSLGGAAMIAGGSWAMAASAHNWSDGLIVMGFIAAMMGLPAAVAVHHLNKPMGRYACLTALLAMGLAIACWFGAAMINSSYNWSLSSLLFESGWLAMLFGGLATAQLVGFQPRRAAAWWRVAAAGVSAAGMLLLMMMQAREWNYDGAWGHRAAGLTVTAMALAQINVVGLAPLPGKLRWLKPVTIAAGLMGCALLGIGLAYEDRFASDGPFVRVMFAAMILGGAMTIAVLGLAWMLRVTPGQRHVYLTEVMVQMICPHCQTAQRIGPGHSACVRCNLWLHVQVEEPRCPNCDYLLYHLAGGACPECGHEMILTRGTAIGPNPPAAS